MYEINYMVEQEYICPQFQLWITVLQIQKYKILFFFFKLDSSYTFFCLSLSSWSTINLLKNILGVTYLKIIILSNAYAFKS